MNKNIKILLIVIAIVIVVVVGALIFWQSGSQNKEVNNNLSSANSINAVVLPEEGSAGQSKETNNNSNNANTMNIITLPDGLQITDEVVGTGVEAKAGNAVAVNYIGTLADGKKFDSSYDAGRQPFVFLLGAGKVIKGWDEGVVGMKVGGKRKLVIPSALAYGEQGAGNGIIPPNSTLIFEIELLGVQAQ